VTSTGNFKASYLGLCLMYWVVFGVLGENVRKT